MPEPSQRGDRACPDPKGHVAYPGCGEPFCSEKESSATRDGAWLLRVERESYDVVLDRFPWPLDWIKLPWMDSSPEGGMVMKSKIKQNADDLEKELTWFARILDYAVEALFRPAGRPQRRL